MNIFYSGIVYMYYTVQGGSKSSLQRKFFAAAIQMKPPQLQYFKMILFIFQYFNKTIFSLVAGLLV